jgi:hypothetical protein
LRVFFPSTSNCSFFSGYEPRNPAGQCSCGWWLLLICSERKKILLIGCCGWFVMREKYRWRVAVAYGVTPLSRRRSTRKGEVEWRKTGGVHGPRQETFLHTLPRNVTRSSAVPFSHTCPCMPGCLPWVQPAPGGCLACTVHCTGVAARRCPDYDRVMGARCS